MSMIWRSRREKALGLGFFVMCYFYSSYARKLAVRHSRVKRILRNLNPLWSKNSNVLRWHNGTTCGFLDSLQIAFAKAAIALTILFPRLGQCDQKGSKMIWAQLLAYVTGAVDQELLLRNEYLAAENRILKAQIKGRLLLSEEEKATLAEIAHRLGRRALEEVAGAAQPDTILGWYRKLSAKNLMDRDFASEWADHGLLRKSSDWSCAWQKRIRAGAMIGSSVP